MAKAKKTESENTFYEEWQVRINVRQEDGKIIRKVEKLKLSRPRVVITDDEAEALNHGIQNGENTYAKMYFKPETVADDNA